MTFMGLAFVATLAVGQSSPAPGVRDYLESKVGELRKIEAKLLPPLIVEGPPSHQTLVGYYLAANPRLVTRFHRARDAYMNPKEPGFTGVTIVSGPAGAGKTFLKRQVYEDIPRDQLWKFDIHELLLAFIEDELGEMKPDLVCGGRVYNSLPSLNKRGREAFQEYVRQRFKSFTVVDSLDEIHPTDYEFVLHALKDAALQSERPLTHLVVFGRPLAFKDFWLSFQNNEIPSEIQGYVLGQPQFRTVGDIEVSNWNYDCWKHSLHRDVNGVSMPMVFPDYDRWAKQGYSLTGEFADSVFWKMTT